MPAGPQNEEQGFRVLLVRRIYLIAVWFWLLVCLLFPTWTGNSYLYDDGSEQWHTSGAFGITGSGNPMTSRAPIWAPPRSSGGLPTALRWPLAPIESAHCIEIQPAATIWRFSGGLFFAGLVVLILRWTKCVQESDRVLMVASAITVAILTANIVLAGIGVASMGFALVNKVVISVLGIALALGITFGAFVLRAGNGVAGAATLTDELPHEDESPSPTFAAAAKPQHTAKTSTLAAMRSLRWWWKIPAYLAFQFFVWGLINSQPWPVGRDVFGPYKLEPDSVVIAYWLQFFMLPFCSRRFQVFGLSQLMVIVLIYVLPGWPRGGDVFAPFIRVPAAVWPLFWIQFAVIGVLFCRPQFLLKRFTSVRRRGISGDSS